MIRKAALTIQLREEKKGKRKSSKKKLLTDLLADVIRRNFENVLNERCRRYGGKPIEEIILQLISR